MEWTRAFSSRPYSQIFQVLTTPTQVGVNFNATFFGNLHDAIARSINAKAGCFSTPGSLRSPQLMSFWRLDGSGRDRCRRSLRAGVLFRQGLTFTPRRARFSKEVSREVVSVVSVFFFFFFFFLPTPGRFQTARWLAGGFMGCSPLGKKYAGDRLPQLTQPLGKV